MGVYSKDGFKDRVNLAAAYISAGRNTSRTFDSCFEMFDGDAVCLALLRRIQKRPDSKLAANIWRYLARVSVEPLLERYVGTDPAELSAKLIRQALSELQVA